MLTADQATTIARTFGLTLGDAVALRLLTDDPDEAETIAASFTRPGTETGEAPAIPVSDCPPVLPTGRNG